LVVVILILGILAGVAAPKMFNTSAKAADNSLKQTLAIVRDAIELYASQNGGAFPPINAGDSGASFKALLTPYLRGPFPKCPVGPSAAQNANVLSGAAPGAAAPTDGWKYNAATGAFICNNSGNSVTEGIPYDSY
jgi:general secretion pathway protein G